MSSNVFGIPVTNATVQQILLLPESQITAQHRAEVALTYINSEGKADDARRFVANLKNSYGTGTSTLCTIYNATGDNLTFVTSHTWEGHVWQSPYPHILQNGQWGAFLHVRGRLIGPSKEAVVYRGRNLAGASRDWVLAWNTQRMNYQNRVYTEIRTGGANINWNTVNNNMNQRLTNHVVTSLGCFSSVSVGSGSSPNFVGIMSLQGVNRDVAALESDVSTIFSSLDSTYEDDGGEEGDDDDAEKPTPAAADDAKPTPAQ